jgi:transcriptional regulator with GAF, ATPase, and Fis domain
MKADREASILGAFVSIATSITAGYDILDLYNGLTADCAHLLDITAAGLLLADRQGMLHLMAASSERAHELETFQLQRHEGPCLDCFRDGSPVLVSDLATQADRWPQFVPAATTAGFASIHALPMRLQDTTLGALGLFGATARRLDAADLALGQALADAASIALVASRAGADKAAINEQLQIALDSRVVLEQAKGVLAYCGELNMEQAFASLRRYARDHQHKLSDLAAAVVSRQLPAQQILSHATRKDTDTFRPGHP